MKMTWRQDLQYIITEESHPQKDCYFQKKTTGERDKQKKKGKITSSMNNAAVDNNIEPNC